MRDWVTNVENTFYIIGTVAGPHPYPTMVRDFQRVIGDECLVQMPGDRIGPPARCGDRLRRRRQQRDGHLLSVHRPRGHAPDRRRGRRARASDSGRHAASLSAGIARRAARQPHLPAAGRRTARSSRRTRSRPASTIPASAPSTRYLKDIGRAEYVGITDDEALAAFHRLCRTEGIIPALESSHAVAYAMKLAPTMRPDQHLLVNLSGRGDKDIGTVADLPAPSSTAGHRARARRQGRAASA